MRLSSLVGRCGSRFEDLVLPRACAGCGVGVGVEADEMCGECWRQLSLVVGDDYCQTCGDDRGPHLVIDGQCSACRLKKEGHLRFDGFARVGKYAGSLRRLILRFKREFVLEKLLGRMLGDVITSRFDPAEVDFWVPVPSHWLRRVRRGYQPTALLTAQATRPWKGRVAPALAMTRYVAPFHKSMPASERAKAIHRAFKVVSGVSVQGRTVCLIDDVTTTGATLAEAKRCLRKAGAGRILAAVLAKTGRESGLHRAHDG